MIGVLALGSAKENALNPETLETLRVFTNEASIVLDNALLFKQLEQSNLDLEETVNKLKSTSITAGAVRKNGVPRPACRRRGA